MIGVRPVRGYAEDRIRIAGNHPDQAEAFTALGNAALDAPLEMQIRFALRNQADLDQLLADQQNPESPRYHQWLKTGDFVRQFGPHSSDVTALETWLKDEGFVISNKEPGYLEFRGSVAQAQRTFDVSIARFGDGSVYANTADPMVPQRFAGVVGAILGMDNMVRAVPVTHPPALGALTTQLALAGPDASENSGASPMGGVIIGGVKAFGPGDERTFYDETVGVGHDGSGDCVAIVGTSDFLDSAMTTFTSQFGLPAISYTRKLHGSNPGINSNGEAEAELDLQWTHASAPGAPIVYHYGSNLVTNISSAVSDNACGAISISFAFCGPNASFINNTLHPIFVQAAAQGQSVFVSSGDQGAAGLGIRGNSCVIGSSRSVNEMSADPFVTSVGGTQFAPTYSGGNDLGHAAEHVWNDGIGATGGGASEFFSKPSYQTGSGVPNDGARDVPDIALIASPTSPGVFWAHDVSGVAKMSCCIGGTSLSSPLWAGFSRVIAQLSGTTRLGNLNPIIYGLANSQYDSAGFYDVTSGNNNFNGVTGFSAGPGYDQATGWGSVDFDTFANAVKNYLGPHPTPTATPTPVGTPTSSATFTATPVPTATPTAGGTLSMPTTVRFPTAGVGMPALSRPLVITNRSHSSTLTINVGTLVPPFTLSGAGHYSLPPATRLPMTIELSPDNVGPVNQTLAISSSDPKHPHVSVAVSATVQPGRLAAPRSLTMAARMGSSVTKIVTLKNSGKGMLTGTVQPFSPGSSFTLVGGPVSFELVPKQKLPITIQFAPASPGTISANLAIDTAPPPGTTAIVVKGSAR